MRNDQNPNIIFQLQIFNGKDIIRNRTAREHHRKEHEEGYETSIFKINNRKRIGNQDGNEQAGRQPKQSYEQRNPVRFPNPRKVRKQNFVCFYAPFIRNELVAVLHNRSAVAQRNGNRQHQRNDAKHCKDK